MAGPRSPRAGCRRGTPGPDGWHRERRGRLARPSTFLARRGVVTTRPAIRSRALSTFLSALSPSTRRREGKKQVHALIGAQDLYQPPREIFVEPKGAMPTVSPCEWWPTRDGRVWLRARSRASTALHLGACGVRLLAGRAPGSAVRLPDGDAGGAGPAGVQAHGHAHQGRPVVRPARGGRPLPGCRWSREVSTERYSCAGAGCRQVAFRGAGTRCECSAQSRRHIHGAVGRGSWPPLQREH